MSQFWYPFLKLHLFILQGKGTPLCRGVHFEVKGQLEGAGSLLAWPKALLTVEPSL